MNYNSCVYLVWSIIIINTSSKLHLHRGRGNKLTMGADASKAAGGTKDLTLTAQAELHAYSHASRHDCWAVTNVKAPLYQRESRVPVDIVAVIDQSGSMAGEKMTRVKKTLLFVINQRKLHFAYMLTCIVLQ